MMSTYHYVALGDSARQVRGKVRATSKREALEEISRQGFLAIAVEPVTPLAPGWMPIWRPVSQSRLTIFYGQLADLLRSGVPLARSVQVVARQCRDQSLGASLTDISHRLNNGASLSEAMSDHPRLFDELAVNMIRAGEEGGFLEEVLARISDFTKRQQKLKSRVIGAMAYPAFLMGVTVVVLTVMMTLFVPNFAPIFERMRETGHLPALTEALLTTSDWLNTNILLVSVTLAALAGAFVTWQRSDAGRLALDRFKLVVPGFRGFWRGFAVARFTRIFGTMLAGGVPILTALRISKDSAGNRVLADAIARSAESLEQGGGLAEPLRACQVFPDDMIEIIAVAEESNSLPRVLIELADTTEERLSEQIDVLLRLLEPILLLILAGITLLIVSALLLPVFNMGQLM